MELDGSGVSTASQTLRPDVSDEQLARWRALPELTDRERSALITLEARRAYRRVADWLAAMDQSEEVAR